MLNHLSVRPYAHLSVRVRPSVGPLVPPEPLCLVGKDKDSEGLIHAYGIVINLKMVGQKCLSANLYVWQSICLSLESVAHASFQD